MHVHPNGSGSSLSGVVRNVLVVLLSSLLIVVAHACSRSRTPESLFAVGETAEVDGWRVTVNGFGLLPAADDRQPEPGFAFCAVEVTLENGSDQIRFFMPERQMTLQDAGGTVYELDHQASVMAARSRQWTVPDGELSIGEAAHGAASYQIPNDARGLTWIFRSSLLPGSAELTFRLGDAPH